MEILIIFLIITSVAAFFLIKNNDDSEEIDPIKPPSPPIDSDPDEFFHVSSIVDSGESQTSIEFLSYGDVESTYTLGNVIKKDILDNVLNLFPPDSESSNIKFEIFGEEGEKVSGPDSGVLSDSPKWNLDLSNQHFGFRSATFFIRLYTNDEEKIIKVTLSRELSDLNYN